MTNHYSSKMGAIWKNSRLALLAFFAFLLCGVNSAYADAGFFSTNAWNVKVWKGSGSDVWIHYNDQEGMPECANFRGAGSSIGDGSVDLGTVTQLYIKGGYANTWDSYNGSTNDEVTKVFMQYKIDDGEQQQIELDNRDCNGFGGSEGNKAWYRGCDLSVHSNLQAGKHTLYIRFLANTSFNVDRWIPGNSDTDWYPITFTIPSVSVFSPSETVMKFGNVAYGEWKDVTANFTYNGSGDLSESDIDKTTAGSYFEFVSITNNSITYRFKPDQSSINKSYTKGKHYVTISKDEDGGSLKLIFNASSFIPQISGYDVSVQSSTATLYGSIMYTGCNTITEYGVYYSTDPSFFNGSEVDLLNCSVENTLDQTIVTQTPLQETLSGLMSGTTYHYVWYMKDSTGKVTYSDMMDFTTVAGSYRLLINNAASGDIARGFVYDSEDPTSGYVEYFVTCQPRETYQLQYYLNNGDGTYTWVDVPRQSGAIPNEYASSYVRFNGTNLVDSSTDYVNATVSLQQITPSDNDYIYTVYFVDNQVTALQDKYGKTIIMTVSSKGLAADPIKIGISGIRDNFPEGSQYYVLRNHKDFPATDDACILGQAPIPSDYTGVLSDDEVLTVTYTGGDTAPGFSISRDLWVKSGVMGNVQTSANTMINVACTDGSQGYPMDYVVLYSFNKSEIQNGTQFSPFDVMSGGTSIKYDDWNHTKSDSYTDGYIRYAYDTESKATRTDLIKKREDGSADLYVELMKNDGSTAREALELIGELDDQVYGRDDLSLVDVNSLTIKRVSASDGSTYDKIWGDEDVIVAGSSSVSIRYSLKSNCLKMIYSNLQFYRGTSGEENPITVDAAGNITICVQNSNADGIIAADEYQVVLTDNKTGSPILLNEDNKAIAAGDHVCFTSIDPIKNTDSYDISAILKFAGSQVDNAEISNCVRPDGETIHYTIDNSRTYDDRCSLEFSTIMAAMNDLKSDVNYYDNATTNLKKNIVFNVVGGNGAYKGQTLNDITGGDVKNNVNMFSNINNGAEPEGGYKEFIVRNSKLRDQELDTDNNDISPDVAKPVINHIVIRNSRNLKLQYLNIQGYMADGDNYDNAIDIDNGNGQWLTNEVGAYANANIEITNCDISSKGFTCIHVSAYDGILFEDNRITANIDENYSNMTNLINWGASLKFIRCKNVKFIRNTFRGQHVTNMWVQECENMLVMNNVFWTENTQSVENAGNSVAMIRLMSQDTSGGGVLLRPVHNIGVYYNTFYIAANNVPERADILKFGGDVAQQNARPTEYHDVDFNYNNCYSLDANNCNSRSVDPLWQKQGSSNLDIRFNNFWSAIDGNGAQSSFLQIESGEGPSYHINVPNELCSTANDDPDGLIVRGSGLNLGSKIESDISGQGAGDMYTDRLNGSSVNPPVRPTEEGSTDWTLGAYQQSDSGDPLGTIYWAGGQNGDLTAQAWDLRSNWRAYDPVTKKLRQVNCMDTFSDTLLVIIPATDSRRFPIPDGGIKNYPRIPTNFYNENGERDVISNGAYTSGEGVQAGLGMKDIDMSEKPWFFKTVYIEYGGTLLFANYLYNNPGSEEVRHYEGASASYVGPRDIWALTGTVIRPFKDQNDKTQGVRNVISGDYYLNNEPRVQMRYADVNQTEGEVVWTRSFASLDVNIEPGMQFAVYFSKYYGLYGQTDNEYAASTGKTQFINHGDSALTFNFYGHFAAEDSLPMYDLKPGQYNLLNNYLPANLSAKKILEYLRTKDSNADLKYYVIAEGNVMGSFVSVNDASAQGDFLIYPKAGFLVKAEGLTELQITGDMVVNSSTEIYRTRNMEERNPYVTVAANNFGTDYGSRITAQVNSNVNEYNFEAFAKDKLFNGTKDMSYVPDIYVMLDDSYDEVVAVPNAEKVIPLGVRVREKMDLNFYVYEMDGINEVYLEDRATGEFRDIVRSRAMFRDMEAGDYKGRFYLHLSMASEDDPVAPEDPDGGSDTPTSVVDTENAGGIEIYNSGNVVMVSSSSDILLAEVYITDMSGRTKRYAASGNYLRLVTDLVPGVYVVNAIGDKGSAEQKIVVK